MLRILSILLATCLLLNCSDEPNFAPVTDVNIEPIPATGVHSVKQGETLYAIAWRYGLDYRVLANRNRIAEPYTLLVGQKINVADQGHLNRVVQQRPAMPEPISHKPQQAHWIYPVSSRIIDRFASSHKGINFEGHPGMPIHATASGIVVYSGNGLRSYGNLIIIKHSNLYFSAYAHNKINLVKEGQTVTQGQIIAEMGNSGTNQTMLHFEIRKAGVSIDPTSVLN